MSDVTETLPSKTFCALPWVHMAIEPNGKIIPCCQMGHLHHHNGWHAGDLNTTPIEDIWNGSVMKGLRKDMLAGIEPKICSKCFDRERAVGEGKSIRGGHNIFFKDMLKNVKEVTSEDGTCSNMSLKYWDFRFSNKCNFKCRSCGPDYSSNWVEDSKKLVYFGEEVPKEIPADDPRRSWMTKREYSLWDTKVTKTENVNNVSRYEFLRQQVKEVQKIYFAGGEPLVMDEHYFVLDLLLEQNRTDVTICYNTNTSTLKYKDKNVLDYWRKWDKDKVQVWPSIDEVGPRAELVRKGTVWSEVESNLKQIAQLDIEMIPGMTISAFNVFRIPEIIEHLISIGVITKKKNYSNWFLNLLYTPDYYQVTILSDRFKKEITEKLKAYIATAKEKYNTDFNESFSYVLHQLSLPHNPDAKKRFIETTYKVDTIRNENTYDVIPELNDVFS